MKFSQYADVSRNVVGTPLSVKKWSASALPSKCATLNLPWSVGIRSSSSGIHLRESSKVDQIACWIPACLAAPAMLAACAISLSAEKCSQKFVRQYAP